MARRRQNAADEAQLAKARRFEEHNRLLDDAALEAILQTPAGRRFVYGLIAVSGVFDPSYTGNTETFYNEGRRSVGIVLMKEIQSKWPGLWKQTLIQIATEREALASAMDAGSPDDGND